MDIEFDDLEVPVWIDDSTMAVAPTNTGEAPKKILLHKGTEIPETMDSTLSPSAPPHSQLHRTPQRKRDIFNLENLRHWAKWRTGLGVDFEYLRVVHAYPYWFYRHQNEITYLTQFQNVFAGGAIEFVNFTGLLPDSAIDMHPRAYQSFGWSLSIGGPGLKYTLRSSPWALPEYSWLEQHFSDQVDSAALGDLIRQWREPGELKNFSRNKAHHFDAKLGVFQYKLVIDSDVYRRSIHDFRLTEIPFLLGNWGMGITGAGRTWIPGMWLALGTSRFDLSQWIHSSLPIHLTPVEIEMRFQNLDNFFMGLRWKAHIGDPLANSRSK